MQFVTSLDPKKLIMICYNLRHQGLSKLLKPENIADISNIINKSYYRLQLHNDTEIGQFYIIRLKIESSKIKMSIESSDKNETSAFRVFLLYCSHFFVMIVEEFFHFARPGDTQKWGTRIEGGQFTMILKIIFYDSKNNYF